MITPFDDTYFMKQALKEAEKAFEMDEIPVGAVVVAKNQIIARAHNLTERLNDVTAHAEMQAITSAAENIGGKFLDQCTLYVTLEPCVMCGGAIFWARFKKVVFGAFDPKRGYSSVHNKESQKAILHPNTEVIGGVLENECAQLVRDFFKDKR